MRRIKLDTFDQRLLNIVQHDASLTSEQLGEIVGLSASAVQRRLKRLKNSRVITAEIMVVDPKTVGAPSLFVVSLELEEERSGLLGKLRNWLSAQDEIQEAFYVTGTSDFLIIVSASDVSEFELFMRTLLEQQPIVRRYTTSVVLGVIKRSLAARIGGDE